MECNLTLGTLCHFVVLYGLLKKYYCDFETCYYNLMSLDVHLILPDVHLEFKSFEKVSVMGRYFVFVC